MKSVLAFSLLLFIFSPPILFAQESAKLSVVDQKIASLEARVKRLKNTQEKVIHKQSEISAELDSLKIWIRRHRG